LCGAAYGGFHRVDSSLALALALTPLHALIGTNDSGKSTELRAQRPLAQSASGMFGLDAGS
jgi:ABC-type uncharacterized transport system ATPase subunit